MAIDMYAANGRRATSYHNRVAFLCARRPGGGDGERDPRRADRAPILFSVSSAAKPGKSKGSSGSASSSSSSSSSAPARSPELNPARTFQLGMLGGAAAGFVVDSVLFPIDTLKTRLQMGGASSARRNIFHGMYNGFLPAVAASAPAAAAFFGTYDYVKRVLAAAAAERAHGDDALGAPDARWLPVQHMLAAAAGDVASATVRNPFEVVKQRLQSGLSASTSEAVRTLFAKQGVRGFYAGYGSLVLRELPFDAIQFPLYEFLKSQWARRVPNQKLETWQSSLCGSVAGGVSAALTTPFDVVKTRLMTQGAATSGGPIAKPYTGLVDGLKRIATEEGYGALFAGVTPRVMWISAGGFLFFGSYEAARKTLLPHFSRLSVNDSAEKGSSKDR